MNAGLALPRRARPPSPGSPSLAGIVLDINALDFRMHIDNVTMQLARIAGKLWQRSTYVSGHISADVFKDVAEFDVKHKLPLACKVNVGSAHEWLLGNFDHGY